MTPLSSVLCQGEIQWRGGDNGPILVEDFTSGETRSVRPDMVAPLARTRGHGGADFFLVNSFTKAVARQDPGLIRSGPAASLASHLMVFRAEESRREGRVVVM